MSIALPYVILAAVACSVLREYYLAYCKIAQAFKQ